MADSTNYTPRLQQKYKEVIQKELLASLNLNNVFEVPKNSKGLTLVRTDAFTHTALCSSNNSSEFTSEFTIDAIVGRLYIIPGNLYHYVKPFDNEGHRRSMVFNINCSSK